METTTQTISDSFIQIGIILPVGTALVLGVQYAVDWWAIWSNLVF